MRCPICGEKAVSNICDLHLFCHVCTWSCNLPLPDGGLKATGSTTAYEYVAVTI